MKSSTLKLISLLLITAILTVGCADSRVIDGKMYDSVGVFNRLNNEVDSCIRYRIVVGNVVWSVLLMQTVIAPIYFIGFSLFEPVERKLECMPLKEGK